MNNWTIGKRVTVGFATVLLLSTALAVAAYVLIGHSLKLADQLATDPLPGSLAMSDINDSVAEGNIEVARIAAATPQDRDIYIKNFEELKAKTAQSMKEYDATIHIDEDRQNFTDFNTKLNTYYGEVNKLIEMAKAGNQAEANAFLVNELGKSYEAQMDVLNKMLAWNFEFAKRLAKESTDASRQGLLSIEIMSVIVILMGVGIAISLIMGLNKALNRITGALNDGANHVSSAANQVSTSSQSLAEGASEQAASIEETSASLNEISGTIERNSQTAQATKELAQSTRTSAEHGVQSTQDMNRSIDGIKSASQDMGKAMDAIKAASSDIANIIKTIDEIAFQTNLLALNAAVEAARAGEAGAGFAVVADEVRNLAQRSAKAAKETAAMIETAIQRSNNGVTANQKVINSVEGVVAKSLEVSQKLQEIVGKVAQVDEQVAQIATASKEQSQGIGQITTAVGQMEQVTQTNASGAEESAAAAEELSSQAEVLKGAVKELQALVGGQKTEKAGATPSIHMPAPQVRAKSFAQRAETTAIHPGGAKN